MKFNLALLLFVVFACFVGVSVFGTSNDGAKIFGTAIFYVFCSIFWIVLLSSLLVELVWMHQQGASVFLLLGFYALCWYAKFTIDPYVWGVNVAKVAGEQTHPCTSNGKFYLSDNWWVGIEGTPEYYYIYLLKVGSAIWLVLSIIAVLFIFDGFIRLSRRIYLEF